MFWNNLLYSYPKMCRINNYVFDEYEGKKLSSTSGKNSCCSATFERFYLFIFRQREMREKVRERNINQLPLTRPQLESGPQPSHVPWPGIEQAIFWFAGWCPTHWATPFRACCYCTLEKKTFVCRRNITTTIVEWTFQNCLFDEKQCIEQLW